jgi:hypothetical protein
MCRTLVPAILAVLVGIPGPALRAQQPASSTLSRTAWTIDTRHSELNFRIRHFVSRVNVLFLVLEELDVLLRVDRLHQLAEVIVFLDLVVVLEVLAERVLAHDDRLDLQLRDELQVVDGREVGRVRHGDREHPPDPAKGQHQVLLCHVRGDELQDLLVDGDLVEVHGGHAVLLGQHARELFLGDEAELHQRVAEPRPLLLSLRQRLGELDLRDQSFPDEEVTQTILRDVGCGHAFLWGRETRDGSIHWTDRPGP